MDDFESDNVAASRSAKKMAAEINKFTAELEAILPATKRARRTATQAERDAKALRSEIGAARESVQRTRAAAPPPVSPTPRQAPPTGRAPGTSIVPTTPLSRGAISVPYVPPVAGGYIGQPAGYIPSRTGPNAPTFFAGAPGRPQYPISTAPYSGISPIILGPGSPYSGANRYNIGPRPQLMPGPRPGTFAQMPLMLPPGRGPAQGPIVGPSTPLAMFSLPPAGSNIGATRGSRLYSASIGPTFAADASAPVATQRAAVLAKQYSDAQKVAATNAARLAEAEARVGSAYAQSAIAMGMGQNELRRRGALTTEFIAAAGRGTVSVKEFGYQIGATTAKFAGWTAAAAAVYGVVSALGSVGRGAIEAQQGIAQVSRIAQTGFDKETLARDIRDLSRTYATSIQDTSDTVYELTKLFGGNVPDAVTAASVALQGLTIGELNVRDSTAALNTVVKGFGLNVSELQTVFDAVNQVQAKFGGNTGQLVVSLAKGAAQARSTGVTYKELIALQRVAIQYGGRTEAVAATAISRSMGRFSTDPGQKAIRDIGVNPEVGYMNALRKAADIYNQPGTSAEQRQKIAAAFVPAGQQFAPILQAILKNRSKVEDTLQKIADDEANKRTRQQEQRSFLGSPQVQIRQLRLELERLGSALSNSGALVPLMAMVKALNQALQLSTQLVEAFNSFPLGIGKAIIPLLEVFAVLKLIRRFDVGGAIPGTGRSAGFLQGLLGASENQRVAKTVTLGLRDSRNLVNDAIIAKNREFGAAQIATLTAREGLQAASLTARADPTAANKLAVVRAEQKLAAALEAERTIISDRALLAREGAALEAQSNRFRANMRSGMSSMQAANAAGIAYMRPNLDYEQYYGSAVTVPGAGDTTAPATAAGAAGGVAATKRWQAAKRAASSMRSGVATLGRVISASFFEIVLAGLLLQSIIGGVLNNISESNKQSERIGRGSGSAADLRKQADEVKIGITDRLTTAARYVPFVNVFSSNTISAKQDQKRSLRAEARSLEQVQKRGRLMTLSQIESELQANLAVSQTLDSRREAIQKALARLEESWAKMYGGDKARRGYRSARDRLNDLLKNPSALQGTAGDKGVQDAEDKLNRYGAATEAQAANQQDPLKRAKFLASRQREVLKRTVDVYGKESKQYLDALKSLREANRQVVTTQLSRIDQNAALASAQTADPIAQVRIQIRANYDKLRLLAEKNMKASDEYRAALLEQANLRNQLAQTQLQQFQANVGLQTARSNYGASQGEQLRNAVKQAESVLNRARGLRGVSPTDIIGFETQLQEARNAYADYVRQQAQAMIDARAAFASSMTDDPVKQARIELRRVQQKLRFAQSPSERLQARAEINDARRRLRSAAWQSEYDNIEFLASIGKLDTTSEIARLQTLLGKIKGDKQRRREIQQRIYQLQQQSEQEASGFALDVGSLKMPTIYDVRKAFDPVRAQVRANVSAAQSRAFNPNPSRYDGTQSSTNTANTTVNVYVNNAGDAEAVYSAVDRAVKTNVRARMRNRRMR